MLPRVFLIAFLLIQTISPTYAQTGQETEENSNSENEEEDNTPRRFWRLSRHGGDQYIVALDKITSISRHTYLLDGSLVVTEITIDTNGDSLCRIYQVTPASEYSESSSVQRLADRSREILKKGEQRITGLELDQMAQKKYGLTTHSKTVEYMVDDVKTLDSIFNSLWRAWKTGKGRKYTLRSGGE